MNNYELISTDDMSEGMNEARAAEFHGATTSWYVVTNPTWNSRLTDPSSHAAFRRYMEGTLNVTCVEDVTLGYEGSDRFYFQALNF